MDVLDGLVRIHLDPLDDDEVHEFQAKEHSNYSEFENGLPVFSMWIVPSKEEGMAYIVVKSLHQLSDGISLLQMFSLM